MVSLWLQGIGEILCERILVQYCFILELGKEFSGNYRIMYPISTVASLKKISCLVENKLGACMQQTL